MQSWEKAARVLLGAFLTDGSVTVSREWERIGRRRSVLLDSGQVAKPLVFGVPARAGMGGGGEKTLVSEPYVKNSKNIHSCGLLSFL